MFSGTVVGEVWASKKVESLVGLRLLLISPDTFPSHSFGEKDLVVAADPLGAGIGERVIVAYGHAARNALGRGEDVAIEACVVGIVDDLECVSPLPKWERKDKEI